LDGALKMYPPVYDYANVMLSNSQGDIIYVLNRHGALKDMDHILPESWQEAFKEGKKEVYLSDVFRSRRQADQFRHDPDAALERKVVFGQSQAIPIQEALEGNSGHGFSIDYRGKKVIAVWRHVPSLDWGMVAKIDVSEASQAAATLRGFVLLFVAAVVILSIFLALIVAKSISDPIQVLEKAQRESAEATWIIKSAQNLAGS